MNDAVTDSISRQVLEQAASWLLLMQEGPLTPAQQLQLESWRGHSVEHQRAWRRAERLLSTIGNLPPTLAKQTLERPLGSSRRAVLRGLALLIGAAPLTWWAWRAPLWRGGADYLTAVGERREVLLEDGSEVVLNTDTALDVRFDSQQRLLGLSRGEIYISTAADRYTPARPFHVQTEQGLLLALGTAFSVRQQGEHTVLAVYEGAVQVRPGGHEVTPGSNVIAAGQQVRFDRQRIADVELVNQSSLAWQHGLLVADAMPLQQWTQELMRYNHEILEYDPALRTLKVSGTYPLDDLALALAMLAQTYAVRPVRDGQRVLIRR